MSCFGWQQPVAKGLVTCDMFWSIVDIVMLSPEDPDPCESLSVDLGNMMLVAADEKQNFERKATVVPRLLGEQGFKRIAPK